MISRRRHADAGLAVAPALLLTLTMSAVSPAQVQPNSPEASLTVNAQSGNVPVEQGGQVNVLVEGAPFSPVGLWLGQPQLPPIYTQAGWLNTWPPDAFLLNGIDVPQHATDGTGQIGLSGQMPWLAPTGVTLHAQAFVEDLNAMLGYTLTAPASITIGPSTVGPAHLFFDPTTGALGVPGLLPLAGTQPGDLPTLTPQGFPGPTGVTFNGLPVHNVMQNPFTCHLCHGSAQPVWNDYVGTMMANASRDPLFNAQFSIAVAGMEFLHSSGVTDVGGELAADFCIRCHSPNAWHGGRSGFLGDGVTAPYTPGILDEQHSLDQEGVSCDLCHRTTGFAANASPTAHRLAGQPDSSQLVLSPALTKRGPYPGTLVTTYPNGTTSYGAHRPPEATQPQPNVPHLPPGQEGTAVSPFHGTEQGTNLAESTFCGSCHNITNPLTGHAIERTYTEWLNSDYGDPASPDYKTCQDCHMDHPGGTAVCSLGGTHPVYGSFGKVRSHVRSHSFVGGNAWIPQILKQMYPLVDQNWTNGNNFAGLSYGGPASRNAAYDAVTARAQQTLRDAAEIDLTAQETTPGVITADVTVTNLTGHKLPTGYTEGRQMWINVEAEDDNGVVFFQSGVLDASNVLIHDPQIKIYHSELALNYPSIGLTGPSFHFALNNAVHVDNRIPPKGHVAVRGLGGTDSYDPVQAPWPTGGLYPDNQHWDTTTYAITVPPTAARPVKVRATVFYQTASFEYVSFLANGGDASVQTMPHPDAITLFNLWFSGYAAPAVPVGVVGPASTPDPASPHTNQTALAVVP